MNDRGKVLRHLEKFSRDWGATGALLAEAGIFLDYERVRKISEPAAREGEIMQQAFSKDADSMARHARLYFCFADVSSRIAEMKMLLRLLENGDGEEAGAEN